MRLTLSDVSQGRGRSCICQGRKGRGERARGREARYQEEGAFVFPHHKTKERMFIFV